MKTIYYFHVGRGGRFNNAGHKKFVMDINLDKKQIEDAIISNSVLYLQERNSEGKFTFSLEDDTGREITTRSELRQMIKDGRVTLDFDTIYNRDIYVVAEELDSHELSLILKDGAIDKRRKENLIYSIYEKNVNLDNHENLDELVELLENDLYVGEN